VISALGAAAAAAGARRTRGLARVMLGGGALLLALPALSIASVVAIALLAKWLGRGEGRSSGALFVDDGSVRQLAV
jgi:membrane protein implicated in regulation of membrane protease activity